MSDRVTCALPGCNNTFRRGETDRRLTCSRECGEQLREEVRQRVDIVDLVGREVDFDVRKSNPSKGEHWACCPFHQERTPSFKVCRRRQTFICFGCGQKGDVFEWVKERRGVGFVESLSILATEAGLTANPATGEISKPKPRRRKTSPGDDHRSKRAAAWKFGQAQRIWREAIPDHPLLIDYLAARNVDVDALARFFGASGSKLPPTLRLHPNAEHRQVGHAEPIWVGPAMIGLIGGQGATMGIHRTWITAEGRQTLRGQKLAKQWLGRTGEMDGHPVRFCRVTSHMVVGEGIESTLVPWSALLRRQMAEGGPVWSAEAALTRGAISGGWLRDGVRAVCGRTGKTLPSSQPDPGAARWKAPDEVEHLAILAEGSAKSPELAEREYTRAQRRHRLRSDGSLRRCDLRLPGGDWGREVDFADDLEGQS